MQIFIYDIQTKKHRQLTFGPGNKEESSWSVGGDYILTCVSDKAMQRLALCNVISGELRFITDTKIRCSYPSWSGLYQEFPVLID